MGAYSVIKLTESLALVVVITGDCKLPQLKQPIFILRHGFYLSGEGFKGVPYDVLPQLTEGELNWYTTSTYQPIDILCLALLKRTLMGYLADDSLDFLARLCSIEGFKGKLFSK